MVEANVAAAVRYLIVVTTTGLLAFACSSSGSPNDQTASDAASDGASDGATSCVLRDGGCGAGCCGQDGARWDEARDCLAPTTQIIGCAPVPAGTNACAFLGVVGCAVTPAGTFFTPSRAAGWETPASCSDAIAAKVKAAKQCAAADAGADGS